MSIEIRTKVICNTSRHTSSGTATFGSNLRADTLDCVICRKAFNLALAFAFAAVFDVTLAKDENVGLNIASIIMNCCNTIQKLVALSSASKETQRKRICLPFKLEGRSKHAVEVMKK